MIELIWSVICARSSIDSESNNVSLFEALEQLNVPSDVEKQRGPSGEQIDILIPQTIELISLWRLSDYKKPEKAECRVRLRTPQGIGEVSKPFMIDLSTSGLKRFRTVMKINGIPFKGFGTYFFVVELRNEASGTWEEKAKVPIDVEVLQEKKQS